MDPCEQHLIALRDELARRGVRCELDDRFLQPVTHCAARWASRSALPRSGSP